MTTIAKKIDDIAVGGSRVVIAIGPRRYLFNGLSSDMTANIAFHRQRGTPEDSVVLASLLRQIPDVRDSSPTRKEPARGIYLSSALVTSVCRQLSIFTTALGVSFLIAASIACLRLASSNGVKASVHALLTSMHLGDFLLAALVYALSIFVHELGHATFCLKATGIVGSIRVRLSNGLPAFTTDVSGLHWVGGRDRAKIAVAGALFQAAFGSFLLASSIPAIQFGGMMALAAAAYTLIPFPGADGFWFINDALGIDLSKTFAATSIKQKLLHIYTLWLVSASLTICYLLLASALKWAVSCMSSAMLSLHDIGIWLLYALYISLVLYNHTSRAVSFIHNGEVGHYLRLKR